MTDPRTPCIIGVAQRTIHPGEGESPEPLVLWEDATRAAAADSGGNGVVEAIDHIGLVYSLSWSYDDGPARLAERLGVPNASKQISGLSGTSPQKFLQAAAADIMAGRSEVAVVVGAEALYTKRQLKKQGRKLEWSFPPAKKAGVPFDDPFHPSEIAHQVFQAYLTFALFDVTRRAHLGAEPDAYRAGLGELLAPLSEVAAKNPAAWFPRARSAAELVDVTPENRLIAYPYTKFMVAVMDVDMSAAVIVTSHEKADTLGVPADRRVYLRGWGNAREPIYIAERVELWHSPAMEAAGRLALSSAGIGIDDVKYLDLYSCFGSSVHYAKDALGIAEKDPRPMTVTGGLPFHGGPGNNYMGHSIATMVEKLREDPESLGLVSGVGMHMTNHTFGVYSATPGHLELPDDATAQSEADEIGRREIRNTATGPVTIAAYSVVHGREGPGWGLAICDLPSGERCYARVDDPAQMLDMESSEWVGREVLLEDAGNGVNRVKS